MKLTTISMKRTETRKHIPEWHESNRVLEHRAHWLQRCLACLSHYPGTSEQELPFMIVCKFPKAMPRTRTMYDCEGKRKAPPFFFSFSSFSAALASLAVRTRGEVVEETNMQ